MDDIIKKVRKLLALAKSPNVHEAAAALAAARRLMDSHGIKQDNIDWQEETTTTGFGSVRRNTKETNHDLA